MAKRKDKIKTEPSPLEGAVPVGGFLLTARLEDSAPASSKFPGLAVLSLLNKPMVLLVTLKNITDHDLSYVIENGGPQYQVDVCGGVIRYGKKQDFLKEETLRPKPALTALGSKLYDYGNSFVARSTSYQKRTIKSSESAAVRIFVDYIYDLTESGLYQISVRHLFPIHQLNEQGGTPWGEYIQVLRYRQVTPGITEEAVSNPVNVFVLRDAVVQ